MGDRLEKLITEGNEKLEAKVSDLEAEVNTLKQDKADRDRDARALNIIIRGIEEKQDEKLYLVMGELFTKLGTSFNYSLTQGSFRMGKRQQGVNNNKNTRYRPIKLKLLTRQQKSELFGLKIQHKENPEIQAIIFTNDMTSDEMLQNKVIQQIHSVAKDMPRTMLFNEGTDTHS